MGEEVEPRRAFIEEMRSGFGIWMCSMSTAQLARGSLLLLWFVLMADAYSQTLAYKMQGRAGKVAYSDVPCPSAEAFTAPQHRTSDSGSEFKVGAKFALNN